MKRIATATVDEDLHGTGRDGFTDGNAPEAIPDTHLNAEWFNHMQEEIANAVESSGQDVITDAVLNYFQLDNAVQSMSQIAGASQTADYVLTGMQLNVPGAIGLSISFISEDHSFVYQGRRYYFTDGEANDQGWDVFDLTASQDHYFYASPGDSVGLTGVFSTPPRSDILDIDILEVAVDGVAPATPAGKFLWARVRSDGAGPTEVTYFNRGPRLQADDSQGVEMAPRRGTRGSSALVPVEDGIGAVNLGQTAVDSTAGRFGTAYIQRMDIQSSSSSLLSSNRNERYTLIAVTAAAGTDNTIIPGTHSSGLPSSVSALICVRGAAFSTVDPTDGYSFDLRAHAHIDGTWDLDGDFDLWDGGAGGQAAGCSAGLAVNGNNLELRLTGHTSDAMRWFCEVHVLLTGD